MDWSGIIRASSRTRTSTSSSTVQRLLPVAFFLTCNGVWVTALPMQDHLNPVIFDTHDDFMQDGADNPPASRHCSTTMRPGVLPFSAKAHGVFTLLSAENGLASPIEGFRSFFEPAGCNELVVPFAFQFTTN